MKYQNLKSFEKHLANAAPNHLCRCYLVLVPEDQERLAVFQTLIQSLPLSGQSIPRMSGEKVRMKDVLDVLQSPSLFASEAALILDECEKLKRAEIDLLTDYLEKPDPTGYLLLGACSKTPLSKISEKIGVVFDLSEEKPWEREKRITENLFERATRAGKRLAPDAATLLLERIGCDASLLEQEIDKLICFIADRLTIERSDVFRIASSSRTYTLWQMAEGIVWEGGTVLDPNSFHGLIPSLRSQLTLGLKIASLTQTQVPPEEWAAHLPKIWPKTLEKRKEQVAQKGLDFFKKGLELLLKIELLSRTGSNQFEALFDLFRVSLYAYARR